MKIYDRVSGNAVTLVVFRIKEEMKKTFDTMTFFIYEIKKHTEVVKGNEKIHNSGDK